MNSTKHHYFSLEKQGFYDQILDFWFNGDVDTLYKSKWFVPDKHKNEIDQTIHREFYISLRFIEKLNFTSGKTTISSKHLLAIIILLDQFSRHIYRKSGNAIQIELNTKKALKLSNMIIFNKSYFGFTVPEFIFMLMPFRHISTEKNLNFVLEMIDLKKDELQRSCDLLEKFKKTTKSRLDHLQPKIDLKTYDVLEHHPFEVNVDLEKTFSQGPLVKKMARFLDYDSNYQIVSLSGGVDSMVILTILKVLEKKINYRTVAIHIDYQNRRESSKEAEFLESWCQSKNIIFEKRIITEIKRDVTDRSKYEKLSRQIRFNTYRDILQKYPTLNGIFLGHHKGDVHENVLSNLLKGHTILNLAGMEEVSEIERVKISRPFLEFTKDKIFAFAHKYGVPYFKDTTPTWSIRGKIRNKLIPMLKNIYGDGVLENLSNAAIESSHVDQIVESKMEEIKANICHHTLGVSFPTEKLVPHHDNFYFWKQLLQSIFHGFGYAMTNVRTIHTFIKQVSRNKDVWVVFSNQSKALLLNNILYIFKPGVFDLSVQFATISGHRQNKININVGTHVIGKWKIELQVQDGRSSPENKESGTNINTNINTVTMKSYNICMEEFMTGSFKYELITKFGLNIELNRKVKLIGTTYKSGQQRYPITSVGFPNLIQNKLKRIDGSVKYTIHYEFLK